MRIFEFSSELDADPEELFNWHKSPNAFLRLCPYWEPVEIIESKGSIKNGAEVKLALKLGPIKLLWHLVHKDYVEAEQFCDQQISGPFAYWQHQHLVKASNNSKSLLIDRISYKVPFGFVGDFFSDGFVRAKLNRLFSFRHMVTKNDLEQNRNTRKEKMKILISGSTGLVGKDLVAFLTNQGHQIIKLVRDKQLAQKENCVFWDPENSAIDDLSKLNLDAVIHLAGENIAGKRWTPSQKEKIKSSRIKSTKLLSEAIAKLTNPPKVFVSASAIGFYGDRPHELLLEHSAAQNGNFLSDTCVEWENACSAAKTAGIRVVHPRFGIILSPKGGALSKLLLPFFMGAGGIIGSGKQIMSWISLDDVIYGISYLLNDESVSGPVNFTAPKAVSNKEFTDTLAKVLFRPAIFPVPSFAAKIVFGEMADALLLSSQNVKPKVLEASKFKFAYPDLEQALRHMLGLVK